VPMAALIMESLIMAGFIAFLTYKDKKMFL